MTNQDLDMLAAKIAERIAVPRWLKLSAAVQYSGYGRSKILSLAKKKRLIGYQDPDSERGDWIFDKESIDDYRLSHHFTEKKNALSIIASL